MILACALHSSTSVCALSCVWIKVNYYHKQTTILQTPVVDHLSSCVATSTLAAKVKQKGTIALRCTRYTRVLWYTVQYSANIRKLYVSVSTQFWNTDLQNWFVVKSSMLPSRLCIVWYPTTMRIIALSGQATSSGFLCAAYIWLMYITLYVHGQCI